MGFVATDGCGEGQGVGIVGANVRLGDTRESESTEGRGGAVGMEEAGERK